MVGDSVSHDSTNSGADEGESVDWDLLPVSWGIFLLDRICERVPSYIELEPLM